MATRNKIVLRLIVIVAIVFAVPPLLAPVFLNDSGLFPILKKPLEKSGNRALGADLGSPANHSHQRLRREETECPITRTGATGAMLLLSLRLPVRKHASPSQLSMLSPVAR